MPSCRTRALQFTLAGPLLLSFMLPAWPLSFQSPVIVPWSICSFNRYLDVRENGDPKNIMYISWYQGVYGVGIKGHKHRVSPLKI